MRRRAAGAVGIAVLVGASAAEEVVPLRPAPRHELVVFFAEGHEPMTTLDLPITEAAGEVGTTNLYIPGDVDLYETLERLGWSAIRRSERFGAAGGYVVSFPCACGRGAWWKPEAARELSRAASVDSVRYLERDLEGTFFGFDYVPSPIATVRPEPPGPLTGSVWVRVAVDTCGVVVRASVSETSLPAAYGDAAVAAARRWRFDPPVCEAAFLHRRHTAREAAEIVIPFRFEE